MGGVGPGRIMEEAWHGIGSGVEGNVKNSWDLRHVYYRAAHHDCQARCEIFQGRRFPMQVAFRCEAGTPLERRVVVRNGALREFGSRLTDNQRITVFLPGFPVDLQAEPLPQE